MKKATVPAAARLPGLAKSPRILPLVVLSAGCTLLLFSTVVPAHDVAFSFVWPAYIFAVNKLRFSGNATHIMKPSSPLVAEAWVRKYAAAAGVLALLLPALVCLLHRNDAAVLALIGPHLYLTTAQVLCESFSSSSSMAMLPRMLVPIGFNTFRLWTLWTWCTQAYTGQAPMWHVCLAVANLLFWTYNLFVFLLLNMLPRYLDAAACAV
jgi:hypothetical protein